MSGGLGLPTALCGYIMKGRYIAMFNRVTGAPYLTNYVKVIVLLYRLSKTSSMIMLEAAPSS
ncbi:MAG: hypothetical protein QXR64_08065, partial [Pyrobaculum sp.]